MLFKHTIGSYVKAYAAAAGSMAVGVLAGKKVYDITENEALAQAAYLGTYLGGYVGMSYLIDKHEKEVLIAEASSEKEARDWWMMDETEGLEIKETAAKALRHVCKKHRMDSRKIEAGTYDAMVSAIAENLKQAWDKFDAERQYAFDDVIEEIVEV